MIQQIAEIIKKGRTFLVTSHMRLDGDAVGSELALYEALRGLGKEVVVYNQDRTPQMYSFLPDAGVIVNRLGPLDGFDAVFVLDCSEIERMGEEAPRIAGIRRIVNIGLPAGAEQLMMRLGMITYATTVAALGTAAFSIKVVR